MVEQLTITIPEPLYRRARALARANHRSLDAVIADALDRGLVAESVYAEGEDESPFALEGVAGDMIARETIAYETMHEQLMAKYAGEYVAVFNGQLVDHDSDELTLFRRIDSIFPNDIVLLKRVVPLPEPELRVRSPRLERWQG